MKRLLQHNKISQLRHSTVRLLRRAIFRWLDLPLWGRATSILSIVVIGFLFWNFVLVHADTITTVPISDVTTQWATGGTSDGTCAGGGTTHHCDLIDEGSTPNTADYVHTGTGGTTSVTDEYNMTQVPSVASASQLVVNVYAEAASVGSTADTLNINLKVSGTLQTAATCTPGSGGSGIWAWCTATFTGSWTQTNVNAMNVVISNTINGTGPGSGREDDIRVADIYGTLTYVSSLNQAQASYRLFNNQAGGTFIKAWGGSALEVGYGVTKTSDGGYAVTGSTKSFGDTTNGDMFIAKYDVNGKLSWSKTWGGTNIEQGNAVAQTTDGGYIVTGNTFSFGAGAYDVFVAKFTSTGTFSWSKTWGSANGDFGNAVTKTSDGGFAVAGYTFINGNYDALLAKFTSTGTLSWSKTWGGGAGADQANSVVQTSDGGYAIAGDTNTAGAGSQDAFLAKFTSTGSLSWSETLGGSAGESGASIIQTSDGGYALSGYTNSWGAGSQDALLAKYDSSGVLSWVRTWGGTNNENGTAVVQTSDGGYVITGQTSSMGDSSGDAFIAKFNTSGTLSWSRTWGVAANLDKAYSSAMTDDGGVAIAGQTNGFGAGNNSMFLAKYDSSGIINGCSSTNCKSDTVGGGSDYTSTVKVSGTDFTPSKYWDTTGGTAPSGYSTFTSTVKTDGTDYTSTIKTDGTDYTSTVNTDGTNYTSTDTVVVTASIAVGSALAAQNTAATVNDGTPFRLRIDIAVTGAALNASAGSFKLQYAALSTSCDATPSGNYSDVTDTSTVRYYDNSSAATGLTAYQNANDPTDGTNTIIQESYQESGATTFTNPNAIAIGQDGLWDFALTTYHTLAGAQYCLRIVKGSGTALDSYTSGAVAQINLPSSPTYNQSGYRWFSNNNGGQTTFAKSWGGTGDDTTSAVVQTSDGGYAIAGYTISFGAGNGDAFIAKFDSSGTLSWSKTWGSASSDSARSIVQTSDGGYAIVGNVTFGAGSGDAFIAKFTSTGTLSWSRTWGGTAVDDAYSVVQTSDSGYAVAGNTVSFGAGSGDAFLAKFTSAGALSWAKTWGGATNNDICQSVIQTSDGGYAIAGYTGNFGAGGNDAFLAKFTSTGTLSWSRTWGSSATDEAFSVIQTSDSGYALAAETNSTSIGAGSYDAVLIKFDSSGGLSWSKTWGGASSDVANDVVQTSDGGYALVGYTQSYSAGNDAFLAKFTSSGSFSWSRTFGGSGLETGQSVVQTSDGGYAIAGYTGSFGAGGNEALLLKYDSSGNISGCAASTCKKDGVDFTSTVKTEGTDYSSSNYWDTNGGSTPSGYTGTYTSTIQTDGTNFTSSNYWDTNGGSTPSGYTGTYTSTNKADTVGGGADYTSTTTTIIATSQSATIGPPMPGPNQVGDLASYSLGQPFRLRLLLGVSLTGAASSQSFKLQYATKNGTCSASTYSDVTTSTPIQWYDNTSLAGGSSVVADSGDPTDGSNTVVTQTYNEANNFSNTSIIYAGQDGLWDFSLVMPTGTWQGTDICLRAVTSTGGTLGSYSWYPEIQYGPTMDQRLYLGGWFDQNGVQQSLFHP